MSQIAWDKEEIKPNNYNKENNNNENTVYFKNHMGSAQSCNQKCKS